MPRIKCKVEIDNYGKVGLWYDVMSNEMVIGGHGKMLEVIRDILMEHFGMDEKEIPEPIMVGHRVRFTFKGIDQKRFSVAHNSMKKIFSDNLAYTVNLAGILF